jgi:hypothetical protein
LRAVILDRDSRVAIAWSPPLDALLQVRTGGDVVGNAQMAENQLVTFDVEWN